MFQVGVSTDPALLKGVRGVIFDCDGVIVDSYGANMAYYNHFRERFGLPPMSREEEEYVHAHHLIESLVHVLGADRLEDALKMRKGLDYRFVLPHLSLEPGVADFLLWLKARGIRAGVNTNRTNTMGLLLDHLGLGHFFHPVVETSLVANAKPHPEGVNRILAAWGLSRREVVYLGDTSVDEATAANAGVRFWAYKNPSLSKGEAHVQDYFTLKSAMIRAY